MLRTIAKGFLFGTGFSAALVIAFIIFTQFFLPFSIGTPPSYVDKNYEPISGKESLSSVPNVPSVERYLGSQASYRGDFSKSGVLSAGPGKITGSAKSNGEPVEGLRLRLALNGSVYSEFATTDASGNYTINVPFGDYIIDGYELDRRTADASVPNKIRHPGDAFSSSKFSVTSSSDGVGLEFRFVTPINKKFYRKKFKKTDDLILEWEPYPGASSYEVQVWEKDDPYRFSNKHLFKWSEKPQLSSHEINLNDYNINLQIGKFYKINIYALNEHDRTISESHNLHSDYDFEVVE